MVTPCIQPHLFHSSRLIYSPPLIGVEPRLTRHLHVPLTLGRIHGFTPLHALDLVSPPFKLGNQRSSDTADARRRFVFDGVDGFGEGVGEFAH